MKERYNTLSDYLKIRFGCKVRKVSINAGFTCPTRDGAKGLGGCIYCEPKTLVRETSAVSVTGQIEKGIERLGKTSKAEKFIAYFQINTNTYGGVERLRPLYEEAIRHPSVCALAISTRPDCVENDVLDLLRGLKNLKHLWLEMGLQSAKDSTLELINRGHTAGDFKDAVLRASQRGIEVCVHVIFGLPGEGREDMLNTIRFISNLPVWGIKFHQLEVIRGTLLEEMHKRGEVKTLSLEEYAGLVVESLELLRPDIIIHRMSAVSPRELLVAPLWGLDGFKTRAEIEKMLVLKNTHQGCGYGGF